MYYTYDSNGNVIRISNKPGDGQSSSNSNSDTFNPPFDTGANTGWAGVAYGREPGGGGGNEQSNQYKWDEENRLIHAKVNGSEIDFLYNAGGERTAKQGKDGEVIYYDKMFQVKTNVSPLHITKHIFLGSTRVVSKLSHELGPIDLEYEKRNAYYYHGDHLGSSNYVTDYEGNEYEHYEYTPYGEMWVEEESDSLDKINFKFTSKELDEETGLYYFGARYLDAKTSRWLSCDPILGEYLDVGRGQGGVYNPLNLSVYHYAGNSPLIFIDPTGMEVEKIIDKNPIKFDEGTNHLYEGAEKGGYKDWQQALRKATFTDADGNKIDNKEIESWYTKEGVWVGKEGASLVGVSMTSHEYEKSMFKKKIEGMYKQLDKYERQIEFWGKAVTITSGVQNICFGFVSSAIAYQMAKKPKTQKIGASGITFGVLQMMWGVTQVAVGIASSQQLEIPAGYDLLTPGLPSGSINHVFNRAKKELKKINK